jgi:eukaryotic-like serine/threonine-protein kinase
VQSGDFLEHLRSSGLLSDELVAEVSNRFSNSAVDIVVSDLVGQGLLTEFQVRQLHAGQPRGLVLGQYHLLEELGRGGYGCVYKARHKLMNRIVALKVIAPERVEDSRARAWFRREVLAATQLTHPNIALAFDADEVDGILFFAMEFIDGSNLDALIRERGPMPIGTACEMLLQTAKALQYAHEKGMVHRDIKPANLLIPRDAVAQTASDFVPQNFTASARPVLVKVVDFGLARLQSSSNNNTLVLQSERGFVGTPAYVSPEQARNIHDVDIRSDLYSLGCTFYHALGGRAPFNASTALQILVQHLEKEPEPIEHLRPETPTALASILRRLMAKKPEKRFQTPAELLSELGFFYALDRSGVHRSMPFAQAERVRSLPAEPVTSESSRASDPVVEESNYAPTCFVERKETPRPVPTAPVTWHPPATPTPTVNPPTVTCAPEPGAPEPTLAANPSAAVDIASLWRQWARVVDDLAADRTPTCNDAAYRSLQRDLLDACKAQSADGPRAPLFRQIAEVVQPWLTLAALGGIDRESLLSLQKQSHLINARFGAASGGVWRWVGGAVFMLLIAATSYFALQAIGSLQPLPVSAWPGYIQRHPLAALTLLAPGVLVVSMFVMSKLLRQQRVA